MKDKASPEKSQKADALTPVSIERATLAGQIAAMLADADADYQLVSNLAVERARQCQAVITTPPLAMAFVDELTTWLEQSNNNHSLLRREAFAQIIELLQGSQTATEYFWMLNELRAVQGKSLISESVFALPFEYSAARNDGLVSIVPTAAESFDSQQFYRTFHTGLNAVLKGSGGQAALVGLSDQFRQSIDAESHEYAAVFWLACGCYISCIELVGEISTAHKTVMRQIELVIRQHVVDTDSHILPPEGIELVEIALCNMLTYIACVAPADPVFEQLEAKFRMLKSLRQLEDIETVSPQSAMLAAGVHTLRRRIARLKLDVDALPAAKGNSAIEALASTVGIHNACTLLCTRKEIAAFEAAIDGLKNYQRPDGAVSDLERCAAALIRADSILAEKFQSLAGEGAGSVGSDDNRLNNLLIDELLLMLNPVCDAKANTETDCEWLTVALADVLSAATFVTDSFLSEHLKALKKIAHNETTEVSVLTDIALSMRKYLRDSRYQKDISDSRDQLFAIVSKRSIDTAADKRDRRIDIAELASDNSDLLRDDVLPVESSQVGKKTTDVVAGQMAGETAKPPGLDRAKASGVTSSLEFGDQCNRYVDTIQLALDTALGSSGNLAPDKTVTTALENLFAVVRGAEHDPLLKLIEPLSQVLGSAERAGSTLSQSDTLLVQEAIVAITIGLDAVVNKQSMPELVADVATRITQVAVDDSHKARGGFEAAGLIDVFVEEAEDLGQRLFELFQRWRGAPQGGTKIQTDIRRLLHTLKGSADTVGLEHIASVSHALESFMVRHSNSQLVPDTGFFDISVDAIEVVLDDIDRVRNGESVLDRQEILSLLEFEGAKETAITAEPVSESKPPLLTTLVGDIGDYTAEKTPAFGSAKYFSELERLQQRLSRQHWDSHELHEALHTQLAEVQSSLQSARHLLAKMPSDSAANEAGRSITRSIAESFTDLHELQSGLQTTLDKISALEERQLSDVVDFESLVLTADRISVESVRLRMESLVQRIAVAQSTLVRFEFTGADLELDRKLFAEVNGPVEQLLINAVVHGSQSSTTRLEQGKDAELTVRVVFAINKGSLSITVADDGAGIDIDKVRRQLLKLSVERVDDAAAVLARIVDQGITTSDVANRTSGRGVGLDVVKDWVYRRHGQFSVETQQNVRTIFTVNVPFQSETSVVMVVQQGGRYFGIDIAKVIEIKDVTDEGLSLAMVLGTQAVSPATVVCCRTSLGTVNLEVEAIVGRKPIKFNNSDYVLNSSGLYDGSGLLDNRYVVLRLNTDSFGQFASEHQVSIQQQQPAGASVLIVDDSVTIRASFGRAMQTAGYNIVLARNGLEAVEYLEKHQPEVIILDLEMPLMDGYELGAYIRKEPRLSKSALVVVSSKPMSVVSEWLSAVNADAYYEKPCSESVIARAVAGLV